MSRRFTLPRPLWPLLPLLALLALAGCAGTPSLTALHTPLYRAESHSSSIVATATEGRDGIAEIRIEAIDGEITACEGSVPLLMPSLTPCRRNAVQRVQVCTFANVKTPVSCTLPVAVGARRLISYSATARSAGNRSASSGPVTYAGGAPLTQAVFNVPIVGNWTLAWETARPVIWRTLTPAPNASPTDRIDLGLFPDADMPSYRAFTDDLQPIVRQLFYDDTNAFSTWPRVWRNLVNVWAGPAGADGNGCTRSFAGSAATVRAAFDGSAILHRADFRDCASISLGGGAGTTQTNLADATWVFLHEAGHYLFGLGDEYVGGGNSSISNPRNVFASKASCESASTAASLPASQCVQIGSSGTWRNDDGQPTTMEDRRLDSDFRTLSGRAMANRVTACTGGACY